MNAHRTPPLLTIALASLLWTACEPGADATPMTWSAPDAATPTADAAAPAADAAMGGEDVATPDPRTPAHPDASAGCGVSPYDPTEVLMVGGEARTFVLSVPSGYDPNTPAPLIFALHGLGGSGPLAKSYFGIQATAGSEAIIVYPSALVLAGWGDTGWDLTPGGYDFAFFDALYDHLTESLCIDTGRVFATGHSFGGYMSNSLGCYRSEVLDAIAPVAGGPPYFGPCGQPIGVWLTHGSADDVVELSEGQAALDTWRATNGCAAGTAGASPSPCVAYEGCDRAVHWCQHGGGHEWPSFAATAIWDFFRTQ